MTTDDFLLGSAYAAGEFERLHRQFDTAVVELTACLAEPLERAMRTILAQDIASLLPARAAAVDRFLRAGSEPASAGAADPPEKLAELSRLRHEIAGLGRSLELDPETVAEEVNAAAAELAHHTLALWFMALRRAKRPGSAEPLNANMLPGEMSMQAVLHELDVDAFGVKTETVILALNRYRTALRARAVQSGEPIVFADDLLIEVGRDDGRRPYALYASDADRRRDLSGAVRPNSRPPVEAVRAHMIKLAQRIDKAVSLHVAPVGRYERLIDAALADPEGGRFVIGDMHVTLPSSMHQASAPAVPAFEVADELFAYPIESAADVVAAGTGAETVPNGFDELVPYITSQLSEYSDVRSIPYDKVCTAYAVLVAARSQPMAVDVNMWNQDDNAAGGVLVQEQFAKALDLSVGLSATLIIDASATSGEVGAVGAFGLAVPFTGS